MLTSTQQNFLNEAIQMAQIVHKDTGLVVSGQVAQAALESAWGARAVGNNYFGIKSHVCPYVLSSQNIPTHEDKNGVMVPETDLFATYVDMEHSFRCHALLLLHNFPTAYASKNYSTYIAALMGDPITNKKYATDMQYEVLFNSIVWAHKLNLLDNTIG